MALALENRLIEAWPQRAWRDLHVVVAVSGGADSVALVRAIHAAHRQSKGSGRLSIAHFNHRLRGQASDDDQAWVESLGHELGIAVEVGSGDIAAQAEVAGDGWEAAARSARYEFFRQMAERIGARYVATAHTADDQIETVLHRILRGTGLSGLTGIPAARSLSPTVSVVRPLLEVTRQEVLDYLGQLGQEFRVDETNLGADYTRNRIRNELLPKLRAEYNQGVDQALLRLASQAVELQSVLGERIAALTDRAVSLDSNEKQTVLNVAALRSEKPYLVLEVFRTVWQRAGWPLGAMGFDQWQQLASLVFADGDRGAITLPGKIRAERLGEHVRIER